MKKTLLFFAISYLLLSLAACDNNNVDIVKNPVKEISDSFTDQNPSKRINDDFSEQNSAWKAYK